MQEELVRYLTIYGYTAVFVLIFLQETGVPVPFPNELLLILSGYLSSKGVLFFPFVILSALSADFIGTNILYFLFYKTGGLIIERKPKWFPLSDRIIEKLTAKISKGGMVTIFIFRLTPFTRGYTSVITGLLQVKPKAFLPIAFATASIWAAFYVTIGFLAGPSWNMLIKIFI
jgi:membrane protein DedA with SNARE-associated domain